MRARRRIVWVSGTRYSTTPAWREDELKASTRERRLLLLLR